MERPGVGDAGARDNLSWRDGSENTQSPTQAQAMQRRRLERDHGLTADRAAVVAGLAYGEAAA